MPDDTDALLNGQIQVLAMVCYALIKDQGYKENLGKAIIEIMDQRTNQPASFHSGAANMIGFLFNMEYKHSAE